MKELYHKYFRIPTQGKIREQFIIVRVTITALIIIACLLTMSFTAYAYFSHNVVSGSNNIKAADFNAIVSITDSSSTEVTATAEGTYNLFEGTYSVSLTKSGTADTGFCIVNMSVSENNVKYHTQQLGVDGEETRNTLQFTLDLSGLGSETATIMFTPHWGTSSHYGYSTSDDDLYIEDQETIGVFSVADTALLLSNEETTDVVYTVQDGDTLGAVAAQYNTTVEKLAAYNEIEDPDSIQIGQQIKIPPSDWEIPVTSSDEIASTDTTTQTDETASDTTITASTSTTESITITSSSDTANSTTHVETATTETELTEASTDSSETEQSKGETDIAE